MIKDYHDGCPVGNNSQPAPRIASSTSLSAGRNRLNACTLWYAIFPSLSITTTPRADLPGNQDFIPYAAETFPSGSDNSLNGSSFFCANPLCDSTESVEIPTTSAPVA